MALLYSKHLFVAHLFHRIFKQWLKITNIQAVVVWLLGQDRIEYFIEFGLALFVEKSSSFRSGFFFSKLDVFLFEFKSCSVGSLYNFPKKFPDEIFLVESKIFHKLAFLNFVMNAHTVLSNFINDFINNINFLVWSRFIVVI